MSISFIYIISEGESGPVKIGHSRTPKQRLTLMRTGNPRKLTLAWWATCRSKADAVRAEKAAHIFLEDIRLEGEWFDIEPRMAIAAVSVAIEDLGVLAA